MKIKKIKWSTVNKYFLKIFIVFPLGKVCIDVLNNNNSKYFYFNDEYTRHYGKISDNQTIGYRVEERSIKN